jgi:hypothetical protein
MSKDKEADGLVDITSFNAVAQCEAGHEFELQNLDGSNTGLFLTVQGRHSGEVSRWINALLNKHTHEATMAARRGKTPEPKSLEELQAQNIDGTVIRVIAWRGAKQAFDRDLLKVALKNNPHWIAQIVNESDSDGNFTKAQ